jgi:hypothetical protein
MQAATTLWQKNEFMAFLLLYASKADSKTTEAEINFITKHFGVDAYATAKTLFDKHSDYENLQTITLEKERFYPGAVGKKAIHEYLVELFKADGHFSPMEKVVMSAMERLFD